MAEKDQAFQDIIYIGQEADPARIRKDAHL